MNKPKPCNYVMAALPSALQHCNGVIEENPEYLNSDQMRDFFNGTVNLFLSSIGVAMKKGEVPSEKIFKRYDGLLKRKHKAKYLDNSICYMDSAGYQIQCGYMAKDQIKTWIDLYNEVAAYKYNDEFERFFVVDVAPGAAHPVVGSWQEMEDFNVYSYNKTRELPEAIRKKFYYIHHFRTPHINKVYGRLLFDYDLADGFDSFSTGGLVSFGSSMQKFPVILYVVPLIQIILHCKKKGLKKIKWHTLGASEFKDQLFAKFVVHHIKKVHDIEIDFTYDSSSIFKLLAQSRVTYIPRWDSNQLWKVSLRQDDLQRMFRNWGKTIEDLFYETANTAVSPFGIRQLDKIIDPMYDACGSMSRKIYVYGFMHLLNLFKQVDDFSENLVNTSYPIYEAGDVRTFDAIIEKVMIGFNSGKISKKMGSRIVSLANSLDALTNLDLDYSNWLVDHYMGCDECPALSNMDTACTW